MVRVASPDRGGEVLSRSDAPRTVTRPLFLGMAGIAFATVLAYLWLAHHIERREARWDRAGEARTVATDTAERLAAQWPANEAAPPAAARSIVEKIGGAHGGFEVAVLAPDGSVLVESEKSRGRALAEYAEEAVPLRPPAPGAAAEGASQPRVRARVDLEPDFARIRASLAAKTLVALLLCVCAVLSIYLLVERRILSPIRRLYRPMARMAAGGEYEPVEPRGGDEIAALTARVNAVVALLVERERESRSSAATLALVKQQIPDVIYRYDVRGGALEFLSDSYASMTGASREDALKDPKGAALSLLVPEDRARVLATLERRLSPDGTRSGFVHEARVRRSDGTVRWIEDHLTPEFDEAGRLAAVNGVWRDITQQKQADEALRRQEALQRAISDAALDAMLTIDMRGTLLTANPALQRVSGWTPQDLVGRSADVLLPERLRPRLHALLEEVQAGRSLPTGPVESEGLHRDGHEIPIEAALGIAETPQGRVITVIARDLTHQKAVETQLVHAQKMEAVGTLAGGVAHDFNNLLSVIIGQSELAKARIDRTERVLASLDAITAAAGRGAELTNRLLGFARAKPADLRATDVKDLIHRVRQLLSRTLDRAIHIRNTLPADLPPILADAGQVELAMLNLCINARDAMPRGGTLTLSAVHAETADASAVPKEGGRPGPWVRISVADTGTGIPPEVRSHLFEPFFTTKERGRGTGLGLAMVYGVVVRAHAGRVGVHTEVGKGSRFDLYMPVSATRPLPPPPKPREEAHAEGNETILVIDDDEAVRAVIRDGLREHGYRVVEAIDGPSGLAAIEAEPEVALVVLDMILPHMGGREVFRRLREARPGLPVVLSTGFSDEGDAREVLAQGGDGLLSKPYQPAVLAREVRAILDRRRA
jgi:PAS domain S-box-containing protein